MISSCANKVIVYLYEQVSICNKDAIANANLVNHGLMDEQKSLNGSASLSKNKKTSPKLEYV